MVKFALGLSAFHSTSEIKYAKSIPNVLSSGYEIKYASRIPYVVVIGYEI